MSVFVATDVEIQLKFKGYCKCSSDSKEICLHCEDFVEVSVNADFDLLEDKFRQLSRMREGWSSSSLLFTLPGKMESITVRFSRSSSFLTATAYGPALDKFLDQHKHKSLLIKFGVTFDDGFSLSCDAGSKFTNSSRAFKSDKRCRFFEGNMNIDVTTMFKRGQLHAGKFSLEIMNAGVFDFGNYYVHLGPMLKKLPDDAKYSDFTIIADGDVRIPCHRLFLARHSPVLDRMFQSDGVEAREKCVKMKTSEQGVKAFMKYVYRFDVADALSSPSIATELLDLGYVYEVKPLEKAMKTLLLKRADEWFDLDAAFKMFLRTNGKIGLEKLKEKALRLIISRKDELNNSAVYQEFLKGDAEEVTEFSKLLEQD